MKIKSTSTVHQGPIKMVIYGQSGAGKTFLARTLPADQKVLIVSAESGLLALAGTNIAVIDLATDDEGRPVAKEKRFERLVEVFKFLQTKEALASYSTVFVDSITEIGDVLLDQIKLKHAGSKDGFAVWGDFGTQMINMMKAFRDLPNYHVIFTALEDLDKDENGKRFYSPSIPGRVAKEFMLPAFDIVLRLCFVDGTKRVLIAQGSDTVKAKDRSAKLNPVEEPNLAAIFAKIQQEEKQEQKKETK